MVIDLKPAKNAATVIPIPEPKPYEVSVPFDMCYHSISQGLSVKAVVAAHFMIAFEQANGAHPTAVHLTDSVGDVYPQTWILEGLAELMTRRLAFWYDQEGDTYYILEHDFSRAKEA